MSHEEINASCSSSQASAKSAASGLVLLAVMIVRNALMLQMEQRIVSKNMTRSEDMIPSMGS